MWLVGSKGWAFYGLSGPIAAGLLLRVATIDAALYPVWTIARPEEEVQANCRLPTGRAVMSSNRLPAFPGIGQSVSIRETDWERRRLSRPIE